MKYQTNPDNLAKALYPGLKQKILGPLEQRLKQEADQIIKEVLDQVSVDLFNQITRVFSTDNDKLDIHINVNFNKDRLLSNKGNS